MFANLFLISLILLILAMLAAGFIKKGACITGSLVFLFAFSSFFLMCAMLVERFYAEQFAFLQPAWLIALLLPVFIAIARIYWPEKFMPSLAYPLTGQIHPSFSFSALLARWSGLICALIALCLFIIALARPVSVNRAELPPTQGIDIMMILDASASMNKNDFFPSRFVAAQKNAIRFIGKRYNDRIGMTVFAKNATLASPLTLDHDALQELTASLYIGIVDPNLTAIGDALAVAASHLKNSTAKSKVIVLLTDGSNNAGSVDPLLAAKAAATYGIKVYTIGTASPPKDSLFSSVEDEVDEGLLMNIAKETGGTFYRAKNEQELQQIYNEINELETTDFTQTAQVSHHDAYRPFLLLGLLFLAAGLCLSKLLFIRIP